MNPLVFPAQFLLCLFVDAFLLLAWLVWVSARTGHRVDLSVRFLVAGTFFWAQLAATALLLGIAGFFTRPTELALNFAIAALLFYLCRRSTLDTLRDSMQHVRRLLRRSRGLGECLMSAVVAVAGLLVSWYVVLDIYFPAGGYDDFVYHLPVVGFVIENKSLGIVPVPFHFGNINYFSQLGELFSLWQYAILGSDHLINLWQAGLLVQLVLASYVLCRSFGCRRLASAFGASLICFTPTLLLQTLTTYNDVAVAAFFATGMALSMKPSRAIGWIQPLGIGLSGGLLLAAKMTAPLLVAAILANFVFNSIGAGSWMQTTRAMLRSLAITAIAIAAIGSYWYVRNAIVFRNPVYPFQVQFLGRTFPGVLTVEQIVMGFQNIELAAKPPLERTLTPWVETRAYAGDYFYNYDSTWAGFGPIWFVLGVPSVLTALIGGLLLRRWTMIVLLLITATLFVVFPGNFVVRFSFFVLPIMACAIAWNLKQLAAEHSAMARLATPMLQTIALVLAILTVALTAFANRPPEVIVRQISSPIRKTDVPNTFVSQFRLVRNAIPRSAVLVFDETMEYLSPFWREDYANEVRYIPTKSTWDEWRARMQAIHATHVFVKSSAGMDVSNLPSWIRAHPEYFRLVVPTGLGDLYEVRTR